ncbi:MAG: hypothetical protein WD512_05965 [Candidatus Paceibacterota bacterium]
MKKINISFDYDDTLSRGQIHDFVLKRIDRTIFIPWVVTSRLSNDKIPKPSWNDDLWVDCGILKIPKENIHFTNHTRKVDYFDKNSNFLFHIDDDLQEVNDINEFTSVIGIDSFSHNWREELEILMNEYKKLQTSF